MGCNFGYRNFDLGCISDLGRLAGIPFLMVGCTSAVHRVLRLPVWRDKRGISAPKHKMEKCC